MERGVNKGLLARINLAIFDKIKRNNTENIEYQVSFSMMEIYNENAYDLLVKGDQRPRLRIVDNKAVNLKLVPVANPEELDGHLHIGYKKRSIATTKMNQQSSRAHTIVTIYVKKFDAAEKTQLSSQINVVDLAGSERAAKSGTGGTQLVEGGKINTSLLVLGKVIRSFAEKTKKIPVSHRESKLTLLLKDSIGGNSKTVMLATVSPSLSNRQETRSTLSFALNVTVITNTSKVNTIERLEDQHVEDLLEKLQRTKDAFAKAEMQHKDIVQNLQKEIEDLRAETPEPVSTDDQKMNTVPHLLNLNEDHMLSKVIRYLLEDGKKVASIIHKNGNIILETFEENAVAINGRRTKGSESILIKHKDRLMLGNTRALYVFVDPSQDNSSLDDITFEMALDEILSRSDIEQTIAPDEIALRLKVTRREEEVREANAKAVLLNKPLKFHLQLTSAYFLGLNDRSQIVIVKVLNLKNNCRYILTENEFSDKIAAINDYDEKQGEEGVIDPFLIDPSSTYTPIGIGFARIQSLASNQGVSAKIPCVNELSQRIGKMQITIEICSNNWSVERLPQRIQEEKLV
ncbi:kinesin-like protein KIF28 [Saccostrea echinata]|uniref:kinesin-like protein KIF28 n=1 Tax=Saccostrea echinata TaxID=191078 RepID=UPI002A8280B0|nr:kinesin-like protein KIF28 [Saccostrea echinata]